MSFSKITIGLTAALSSLGAQFPRSPSRTFREYAQDIQDILNDIDIILDESPGEVNAKLLRAVIVLAQMNTHIWYNESDVRNGVKGSDNLLLTHGLNGIRNTAKNYITDILGGRKDHKIDCLAADFKDWEVSWEDEV